MPQRCHRRAPRRFAPGRGVLPFPAATPRPPQVAQRLGRVFPGICDQTLKIPDHTSGIETEVEALCFALTLFVRYWDHPEASGFRPRSKSSLQTIRLRQEFDQALFEGVEVRSELTGCACVDDAAIRDHADLAAKATNFLRVVTT